MTSTKRILFDSHAILKWSQKEPGYQKVKSILVDCRNGSAEGYMNYLNLGEVYYMSIRRAGVDKADVFRQNFLRLPVQLILPDKALIWKASEIKAAHPVSYADCFAAATALRYDASILTGDPEFKKLEPMITIEWL